MAKYVVAHTSDVPDGSRIIVEVRGRSIGIFNLGGSYYGLLNRCPHQGGPMCEGPLLSRLESECPGDYSFDEERKLLGCPWHGWEFDVKTGQSYFDPDRTRIPRYRVEVEPGPALATEIEAEPKLTSLVPGPYVAETVDLAVDDEYIAVLMRD